ncbi:MAG: hypothetical protein ACT4NU_11480 [Chromatiales bacterium]
MKKRGKIREGRKERLPQLLATTNRNLEQQRRKIMRAHYAARYRVR